MVVVIRVTSPVLVRFTSSVGNAIQSVKSIIQRLRAGGGVEEAAGVDCFFAQGEVKVELAPGGFILSVLLMCQLEVVGV